MKTNAMRLLDAQGVSYETFVYSSEIHSADKVADILGIPAGEVFKTLVVLPDTGPPLLVMVPGNCTLDLRALAREVGAKNARMAPAAEAERLTGLQIGGIGALALIGQGFGVLVDHSALAFESILVNPGRRGINVRVPVAEIIRLTNARTVDVAEPTSTSV